MIKMDEYFDYGIEAASISCYICPYTGVEGIKAALECENLYWDLLENQDIETLKTYVDEDSAKILCSEDGEEYTEKQMATAETRLSDALIRRYAWVKCRGASCPKAVVLDVTHEYSKPQHYLFCGFSPLPDRLPKE